MLLAYVLLSVWAAAAAASKQPGRSSSKLTFEDGSLPDAKKDPEVIRGSVYCDPKTEETCYDEWYKAVSCSLISEGGCPCPEGQFRCNADLANGCVGWCTDLCCDWANEYACTDSKVCVKYDGDGCPCSEGQMECYPGAGVCSSICSCGDSSIEETCYAPDGMTISSCAKIADGGCPCPDGQKKCGEDPTWCAMECCNSNEDTCYEYDDGYSKPSTKQYCKAIADGGCPCPKGLKKCGADLTIGFTGWCADVCCDYNTQEQCTDPPSCAPISSGGCPCPKGQEKCGADPANNYTGYCTDVCCDQSTEETCYNSTGCFFNEYCAAIADGGCPCPEGTERCGADLDNNIVGWCDYICCDASTQETCYAWDDNGIPTPFCAAVADGGCPCPDGTMRCGADPDNNIVGWCDWICCDATTEVMCVDWASGNYVPYCMPIADGGCPARSGADSYLHHLEAKLEKLPAKYGGKNDIMKDLFREKFELKQKIEALRHTIKFNDMTAQLSMDKNPELYIKEKN